MLLRRPLTGLLLGVLSVLALAGPASPRAAARTVVTGRVMLAPATPVCHVGTPCSRPLAGFTLAFSRNGAVVRARTDRTGHYRVLLRRGTYGVSAPGPESPGSGLAPRRISVGATKAVRNFTYDAGIR